MKHILRLGVVSALLIGASLPAYSAPSDSDMGFASSREPTASDVGYQGILTRGNGGGNTGGSNAFAGADNGESSGNTTLKTQTDNQYYKNREKNIYFTGQEPFRTSSQGQSHTHQKQIQGLTPQKSDRGGMGLLAPNSTSDLSFKGPQTLGFDWKGLPVTIYAAKHGYFLKKTGTGSVNLSTCAANGKD